MDNIEITINPAISEDQLFSFYQRNYICEEGFGKELACRPLQNSSLIVAAFEGDTLVGIARAMFDGLSAVIMEFCIELEYQGKELEYNNGSLIGKDDSGLGRRMGETLIDELLRMGAHFISYDVFQDYERNFFESLGFEHNAGHFAYTIDRRPYLGDERYITKRRAGSSDSKSADFWTRLDSLIATHDIVIDRPKGSTHPRHPDLKYPLDYGYLKGTSGGDGNEIDVWRGSIPEKELVAVACTVDMQKGDTELKLLLGCTSDEIVAVTGCHSNEYMSCIIVTRR